MTPPNQTFTEEQLQAVLACEQILDYQFHDRNYLCEALTHASVADTRLLSNERLEFLGDSILGFVVCDYLFEHFPDWLEGELTKVKSCVVSRDSCASIAQELGLAKCLVVGKGVQTKGRVPKSLLSNALESIVAALYLDGGFAAVRPFLMRVIKPRIEDAANGDWDDNYKAELQQYAQKRYGVPPSYELQSATGPDHDKWFQISARINKMSFAPAWGKNKKQAEQRAAANALASIYGETIPFSDDDDHGPGGA